MRTKTRKTLIISSLLGLLILGGAWVGYRAYKSARQTRLITQARDYLAKPNERKALLCLQRALRYNPKDIEASRLMAELTERERSPSALMWRGRVVELNPDSMDDRLALVQCAMIFRDYASATNALERVDSAGKRTAAYHNAAGTVAYSVNHLAQAEAHFIEAARLEPTNAVLRLSLAVVRLHGTNAQGLAEARTALKRLSVDPTNSTLRCQALRELVVDALRFKQADTALALSRELMEQTNSMFTDRLIRLSVLQETRDAGFKSALVEFQHEATQGTNAPLKIYELASWQQMRTGPKDALAWLSSLPKATQTNHSVAVLIAGCQTSLQDWRGLQAGLEKQSWAELEPIRYALLARALRGQDMAGAAKGDWELALKAASHQKTALVMLSGLAAQWKWQGEFEELLWSIVNQFPNDEEAVATLSQTLLAGGRTRPLMMLYNQEMKRSPGSLAIKNNLAMTALLLDAQELRPNDLAREVYQKSPTNASYASTYAFSLHLQKKDAEALKVMQQLPPKAFEDPSIAGYYGLILQATGNREKAKAYLHWASKARLLPEEKTLFDRAQTGV